MQRKITHITSLLFYIKTFNTQHIFTAIYLRKEHKGNAFLRFHNKNGYANAPQYYSIGALRTLNIIHINPSPLAKLLSAYKVTKNRRTYTKRSAELYPPLKHVSTNSIFGQQDRLQNRAQTARSSAMQKKLPHLEGNKGNNEPQREVISEDRSFLRKRRESFVF